MLLVVGVHSSQIIGNGDKTSQWLSSLSKNFFDFGARGVQIFFILSAYGLAKSYEVHSDNPIRSYYTRRFFRIYPIWITAVFIHALIENKTQLILPNATFAFGWLRGNQNNPEIVGGSWTLYVEVIFYILFPLLFRITQHTKALVCLLLFLIAVRIIWLKFAHELFGIVDRNSFIGLHPLSNFYCFVLGLLIYNQISTIRRQRIWLNGAAIFFLIFSIVVEIDQILQVMLIGYLMCSWLEKTPRGSGTFHRQTVKLIEVFGKYAFTIYLYHLLLLQKISSYLINLTEKFSFVEIRFLFSMPLILVLLLCLGYLGYEYLEKPSIRIGRALLLKSARPRGVSNA